MDWAWLSQKQPNYGESTALLAKNGNKDPRCITLPCLKFPNLSHAQSMNRYMAKFQAESWGPKQTNTIKVFTHFQPFSYLQKRQFLRAPTSRVPQNLVRRFRFLHPGFWCSLSKKTWLQPENFLGQNAPGSTAAQKTCQHTSLDEAAASSYAGRKEVTLVEERHSLPKLLKHVWHILFNQQCILDFHGNFRIRKGTVPYN